LIALFIEAVSPKKNSCDDIAKQKCISKGEAFEKRHGQIYNHNVCKIKISLLHLRQQADLIIVRPV
jgi:hypothetical protein